MKPILSETGAFLHSNSGQENSRVWVEPDSPVILEYKCGLQGKVEIPSLGEQEKILRLS